MGNYITFDGVNTSSYGITISGEGAFNAPKREVEMFSIPGRNGDFALDKGKFENIEVTYPAANHEPNDMSTFRTRLSDLRNALASRVGYKRLEDTFHPDEYRMAMFKDGLDVNTVGQAMASQFDITFNCKPQRYLKSGETATTVASGGTITNPTLFPSKPLLEVKGYGTVNMNGYSISLDNIVLGNTELLPAAGANPMYSASYKTGLVNNGDTITMASGSKVTITINAKSNITLTDVMLNNPGGVYSVNSTNDGNHITIWITFPALTFTAGTASTASSSFTAQVSYREGAGPEIFDTYTFTPAVEYTPGTRTFKLSCSYNSMPYIAAYMSRLAEMKQVTANSSVSALGDPSYIDCDLGEAYKLVNGDIVSLNNAVSIGSTLPELSPGSNAVTFPNTITEVKIVPRWWKI